MTSDIKMSQRSEDVIEDVEENVEDVKQKKMQDKLKDMGVMPSTKGDVKAEPELNKEPEASTRRLSPVLITVLLALPVAGVFAYALMTDEVNDFFNLSSTGQDSVESNPVVSDSGFAPQAENSANTGNRFTGDAHSRNQITPQSAPQFQAQSQEKHDEWLAKRKADFEKRRAEFRKRNENSYAEFTNRNLANQQAYNQNGVSANTPPDVPQWVKDQQAEMEKQKAQYMQEAQRHQERMAQQNRWVNPYNTNGRTYARENKRPEYFNHPRMNNYQPQENINSQGARVAPAQPPAVAYQQNQLQQLKPQYYKPYHYRAQPNYYYVPAYQYGPYNVPYGWQGPGYR